MISRFFENSKFDVEIYNLLLSLMKKYNIQIAGYTLIDNYKIYSIKTINQNSLLKSSSLFQACSFTKAVTACAVLDLMAQSKIKLDAPINNYLVSWKLSNTPYDGLVTVRHCLSMTSGLCFGDPGTTFAAYTQNDPIPTLLDILKGTKPATNPSVKIIHEPGSQYYYSGAGWIVLQQMIEDVVGQSFSTYMNSIILPKLNMNNSIFECPLSLERRNIAIPGYDKDGKQIEGGWHNIVGAASGGLWTCPGDIANLMLYISKKYLENNNEIKEMLSINQNTDYGLGVVIDNSEKNFNFRKNGYNSGYHNEFIMFPNCGKGIVVMTNSAIGMELINDFIHLISEKFEWPRYKLDFNEVVTKPTKK